MWKRRPLPGFLRHLKLWGFICSESFVAMLLCQYRIRIEDEKMPGREGPMKKRYAWMLVLLVMLLAALPGRAFAAAIPFTAGGAVQ